MRTPAFNKRLIAVLTATACATFAVAGPALASIPNESIARPQQAMRVEKPVVHLRGLTAAETETALRDAGFAADDVEHGVDLYRLVYRTVDAKGRPTIASGLLVLPRDAQRRLRVVSFGHGTEVFKGDGPSIGTNDFAMSPPIAFASAGFAAVAPDYVGLGKGPGTHPWMHVPTETTASLDMLRAARTAMRDLGHVAEREVVVTGFSQGASAALGLARALHAGADSWFRLGAVAPISGAYAFRDVEIPALLEGEQIPPKAAVIYTTYLLVSWNRLHNLYDSPGEVFQPRYAPVVDKLFDGTTTGEDMFAGLPDSLDELLTEGGFELLRHPSPAFARALRTADSTCTGWIPRAPVRLFYAEGDEQAVTGNTHACEAAFEASGAEPTVVQLPAHDYQGSRHLGTAVTGTAAILDWLTTAVPTPAGPPPAGPGSD